MLGDRSILKSYNSDTILTESDERKKIEQPSYEKIYEGREIILTREFDGIVLNNNLKDILDNRKSVREYSGQPLKLNELAYVLWYTYGVKAVLGTKRKATLRTVPSAGARHCLETYFIANNVEGLEQGLYHYNGVTHGITLVKKLLNSCKEASGIAAGQEFIQGCNVLFIWTCIPYRMEWRYPDVALKYALIDAGHLCENLYIAGASIECGVCGIGAYYQDLADSLLEINMDKDNSEVTVYMASFGKRQ
ncbi:MAG: SagB/ThcOx family dehydrogenase [Lachnospiraceae bacterium]